MRGFKIKLLWMSCFVLVSAAPVVWAQQEDDPFDRFIAGGGVFVQGLLLDLEPLETLMSTTFDNHIAFSNQAFLIVVGGGGFAGRDTRIGTFGFSREWLGDTQNDTFEAASLNLTYEGIYLEHLLYQASQFQVSLGATGGGGVWKVEMHSRSPSSFEDILAEPTSTTLRRDFYLIQPYLSAEYHLGFIGLQLQAGMLGMMSFDPWRLPGGVAVQGGPFNMDLIPTITLSVLFGV